MKHTLFSILFLLVSIISGAQVKNVKLFEFEANVGFLVDGKYGYNKVIPGPVVNCEFRFNIPSSPFDASLQLGVGTFFREKNGHRDKFWYNPSIITFADYNFRNWNTASIFLGAGIGGTRTTWSYIPELQKNNSSELVDSAHLLLCPRFGVEIINHIRLTAEYNFSFDRFFNCFELTLGVVFGGGKK